MAKSNKTAIAKGNVMGYLPNDQPPPVQMALLGFQHVLTMFPATVLVAAALIGLSLAMVVPLQNLMGLISTKEDRARNFANFSLGMGMANSRALEDQRQLSVYGRYSLTQDWALSAETLSRDPSGLLQLRPSWWGILGLIGWAYFVAAAAYLAAGASRHHRHGKGWVLLA